MKRDHLTDESLLRALDGELHRRDMARAMAHLEECAPCRERQQRFRQLLESAADLREPVEPGPPHAAVRRLRDAIAGEPRRSGALRLFPGPAAVAGASLVLVLVLGWLSGRNASAAFLPNHRLTPGATVAVTRDQLCGRPEPGEGKAIAADLAHRVFDQYRIRQPRPGAYEVDYLITPALGGADDIRNLWPQPYSAGVWNARVKDALEDYLRGEVCGGRIGLETAQREIASDWIAAYRKYFGTEEPLAAHAMFLKDQPWQGPVPR